MPHSRLTDALLELEHAGWKSLCDGTGDAFYGALMTDGAVMVLANGAVLDRDTVTSTPGSRGHVLGVSPRRDGWELALYQQSPSPTRR